MKNFPKIELHLHLDGSLAFSLLQEEDPSLTLKQVVAKEKCEDLNEYLQKFSLPIAYLQTKEHLENACQALLQMLKEDHVLYAEVRFCPFYHTKQGLSMDEVVSIVCESLKDSETNVKVLLCMMRGANEEENLSVLSCAQRFLNQGVVGVDLAGAEAVYPTKDYAFLFSKAKQLGIPFTIHAGEADGASSVECAIQFGATRIGHGIRSIEQKESIQALKEKKVTLEVCPTSNVQTNAVSTYFDHPIKTLYDQGVFVTINTDNRTVSNITLTEEYQKLKETFGFTEKDFIKMNEYAIASSFLKEEEKQEILLKFHQKVDEWENILYNN